MVDLKDVSVEIVEKIETKDYTGKTYYLIGYLIKEKGRVMNAGGIPAHLVIYPNDSLERKILELKQEYVRARSITT